MNSNQIIDFSELLLFQKNNRFKRNYFFFKKYIDIKLLFVGILFSNINDFTILTNF